MKIYTRRGDAGETDLFGSGRVPKDHLRVEVYGAVDELNADARSLRRRDRARPDLRALVQRLQCGLFELGAYLATPEARHRDAMKMHEPSDAEIAALEAQIDAFEAELPPLERFVLPGGTPAAAHFHLARTVCRRAERLAVSLDRAESLAPSAVKYLNRLSDLLFVLARVANHRARRARRRVGRAEGLATQPARAAAGAAPMKVGGFSIWQRSQVPTPKPTTNAKKQRERDGSQRLAPRRSRERIPAQIARAARGSASRVARAADRRRRRAGNPRRAGSCPRRSAPGRRDPRAGSTRLRCARARSCCDSCRAARRAPHSGSRRAGTRWTRRCRRPSSDAATRSGCPSAPRGRSRRGPASA